jgi:uncharacterized cofD-like protein
MKKVVAIGGGTGLSILLMGLKKYSLELTAIVATSDSGGSSGRLRKEYGVLPPGDIRNCIVALSEEEFLMTKLMNYRFGGQKDLGGHSLGNLLLVALSDISGDFPKAIKEISKVLNVEGQVLPSTIKPIDLLAETSDNHIVKGEVNIDLGTYQGKKKIKKVFLKPQDASAYPESLSAINKADYIIIGPGDLFTSILPNLLIPDITKAIKKSKAPKIYICNVANKFTETHGFKVSNYLKKIKEHLGENIFDFVLLNNNFKVCLPTKEKHSKVFIDRQEVVKYATLCEYDLVNKKYPLRHDPAKLSKALMKLLRIKNE